MSKHRGDLPAEPVGSKSSMVDWTLAARLGTRIAGDGPSVSAAEAASVVAELRRDAEIATGHVRDFTLLDAPRDTAPVLVVGREGWIQANIEAFAGVVAPVMEEFGRTRQIGRLAGRISARATGVEVGGLLGLLSTKVLGQFDPFHEPSGRLLLVAPNVVHVEQQLGVDEHDFRLWVCLHEETHRVQFTAAPWLREHLFAQIADLSASMDVGSLLGDGLKQAVEVAKGHGSLIDAVTNPAQREIIDRVTGMMSLLEGHADVVMDDVGPSVIPTVNRIRRAFEKRRDGLGTFDRILRRLLGLDAKMAQYRDGSKFVRHLVDKVGMAEFNAVFAGPENLPTKDEIADPDAWVGRVL